MVVSEERDARILANTKLVRKIAAKYVHSVKDNAIDFDDLYGEGLLALVKAAENYESSKGEGKSWSTYAYLYISGYIKNYIKRRGLSVPRGIVEIANKIQKNELNDADPKKIARKFNLSVKRVEYALQFMNARSISMNVPIKNGKADREKNMLSDMLPREQDFSSVYVEECLSVLTKKQRQVMDVFLSEECPGYREIGARVGMSFQGVSNSIMRARVKIQKFIEAGGIG